MLAVCGRSRSVSRVLARNSLRRRVLDLIQLGNGDGGRCGGIVQGYLGTRLDLIRLGLLLQGGQRGRERQEVLTDRGGKT